MRDTVFFVLQNGKLDTVVYTLPKLFTCAKLYRSIDFQRHEDSGRSPLRLLYTTGPALELLYNSLYVALGQTVW